MKPEVLLFDEPTAALDPRITAEIADIIRELAQTGITQVIVTHELDLARKTADIIVYMENGCIVELGGIEILEGPKTEAFSRYLLN
jgi:arginine transport system ATP-binding protein